ncbi:hypothetical protein BDZ85DRAFT_48082 [Elsinoe ampelina]|uniref:Tyrosinase copper-binding domain-containing protein n=1 Tax=Elsinoe ampelina TaxID=302913 RepID=A0A6A6GKR1_9PEZI|nr:hypothetical protein BDZ85DRAFT_48082 [Elsinoe ampelina]
MHLVAVFALLACSVQAVPTTRWIPDDVSASQRLADIALENVAGRHGSSPYGSNSTCSYKTAVKRREWHDLSKRQRRQWIDAVLCLQKKPSKIGESAPGARTRYDDFVAIHIQQTLTIHKTGNFLTWHRYYTWAFEQALRNECNYTSYQPYINWSKFSTNPIAAPVFDGTPSSIGGDGAYRPHPGITLGPTSHNTTLSFPPGLGGSCITSGPFANTTVNLGPVAGYLPYLTPNPLPSGLGFNPQCLIRDLNPSAAHQASDANVVSLITEAQDIARFQSVMQGIFAEGIYGVHNSGHYIVGGAPGGDFYTSPGDPWFWLHHAMIDRVWWVWQNLVEDGSREEVVAGTRTMFDRPPSAEATLEDEVELGVLGQGRKLGELVRTIGGPFCYVYV